MKKKRESILVLTSTFPRWTDDTDPPFVFELCRRIKDRFNVHVLCPHIRGSRKRENIDGLNVRRFRYFIEKWQTLAYEGGILNRLRQKPLRYLLVPFFVSAELIYTVIFLKRFNIKIINAHWLIPQGLVAVLACKLFRPKTHVVCTLHGGDVFAVNGFMLRKIKRYVLENCTSVIVVSNAIKDMVVSMGIDAGKIMVIPMGVDLKNTFVPNQCNRDKGSVFFVGRFVEKKGLQYLIKAMPSVLEKQPEAHLNIAGHGPLEDILKKLVSELHLEDSVTFIGPVVNTRLPSLYRSSEIVALPFVEESNGDMEGFGLVAVEALGCECAVIASDVRAVRDIIIDGTTGIITPQKDTGQIAKKMLQLFSDRELRNRLGRNGRQYVLERFDWEITAKRYCGLFEELIE